MSVRWMCTSPAKGSPLPLGALLDFNEPSNSPNRSAEPLNVGNTCPACRAVASLFSRRACPFCGALRSQASVSSTENRSIDSNNTLEVMDYPLSTDGAEHPVSQGKPLNSDSSSFRQDTIFIVDASITKDDIKALRSAIMESLSHIDPNALVGFFTAGSAVSAYELGEPASATFIATGEFFSGCSPLTQYEKKLIEKHELESKFCFMASANNVSESLDRILDTLVHGQREDPARLKRKARLAKRRQHRKNKNLSGSSHKLSSASLLMKTAGLPPARSIFKSIEVALALLTAQHCSGGHIIVFSTGPESSATLEMRKSVGERIRKSGVIVSAFIVSPETVNVSGYSAITANPPSQIVLHSSFVDATFCENVCRSIRRASSLKPYLPGTRLSVRCSRGLHLVQVVGAVSTASEDYTEVDGMTTLHVGAQVGALTLFFELESANNSSANTSPSGPSIAVDDLYVQFIIHTRSVSNEDVDKGFLYVQRVITNRLVLSHDIKTYLHSLDLQLTSVMMAKLALISHKQKSSKVDASKSKAYSSVVQPTVAIEELDYTLQKLAGWVVSSSNSLSKLTSFPEMLNDLALAFYHARRGPLCNQHVHHCDEMDLSSAKFQCANASACMRMMMPELWMVLSSDLLAESDKSCLDIPSLFQEVALSSLNLRSDCILVLDSDTETIIWSGATLAGIEFDSARNQICAEWEKIAKGRFPKPSVTMAVEGSPEARSLLAFLEPSHQDNHFVQLKSVPALASLSKAKMRELRKKLPHCEDKSFAEYIAYIMANACKHA